MWVKSNSEILTVLITSTELPVLSCLPLQSVPFIDQKWLNRTHLAKVSRRRTCDLEDSSVRSSYFSSSLLFSRVKGRGQKEKESERQLELRETHEFYVAWDGSTREARDLGVESKWHLSSGSFLNSIPELLEGNTVQSQAFCQSCQARITQERIFLVTPSGRHMCLMRVTGANMGK